MEVPDEMLLQMYRALYDVLVRDCSRVHDSIIKSLNNCDAEACLNLFKTCVDIKHKCPVSNQTGQLGFDNRFVEGLTKKL